MLPGSRYWLRSCDWGVVWERGLSLSPMLTGQFSWSVALHPSTPVQALAGEHSAVPLVTWVEVSERPALAPPVPQQAGCQPWLIGRACHC